MNWSRQIRQAHRWVSVAFVATVIVNFIAFWAGEPPEWVYLLPLLPLALLVASGLYLFALPYAARWRGAGRAR